MTGRPGRPLPRCENSGRKSGRAWGGGAARRLARVEPAPEDGAAARAVRRQRAAVLESPAAHVAGDRLGACQEVCRRPVGHEDVVDDDRPEHVRSSSAHGRAGKRPPIKHTVRLRCFALEYSRVRFSAAAARSGGRGAPAPVEGRRRARVRSRRGARHAPSGLCGTSRPRAWSRHACLWSAGRRPAALPPPLPPPLRRHACLWSAGRRPCARAHRRPAAAVRRPASPPPCPVRCLAPPRAHAGRRHLPHWIARGGFGYVLHAPPALGGRGCRAARGWEAGKGGRGGAGC